MKEITTERLLLRKPRLDDAEAVFQGYAQDADVVRYVHWKPHKSIEAIREFLGRLVEKWNNDSDFTWMIEMIDSGELIGCVALHPEGHMASVGYIFAKPFWGLGYATEALNAIIALAFSDPNVFRVWAVCDVDNKASARVMEKVGMKKEGVLRRFKFSNISPEPRDACCYAITR